MVSEPQHKPPQRPAMAVHHLDPPRRLLPFLARLKGIPAGRLPQKSRGTERANRMDPLPSLLTAKNDEAGRMAAPPGFGYMVATRSRKAKRQPRRIGVSA